MRNSGIQRKKCNYREHVVYIITISLNMRFLIRDNPRVRRVYGRRSCFRYDIGMTRTSNILLLLLYVFRIKQNNNVD